MMPTNVAARMTLAADPGSLQGAVAAGILGAGPVVLGTSEECAHLLVAARDAGRDPAEVARELRAAGGKVPGFGHPVHKPLDPRAERILELADEHGVSGPHVELARAFRDAVHCAPLTMNVSMPIAAVLLDLGYPRRRREGRADPRAHGEPARAPRRGARGIRPGSRWRARRRTRSSTTRLMLEPEVEARPWEEQLALDDAALPRAARVPARALAVLPGEARGADAGGLAEIAELPLTDKARAARDASRRRTRSARTSARAATRSSASTRRAARPARRATSR